jgi:LCP family protein required for cell wall assembly
MAAERLLFPPAQGGTLEDPAGDSGWTGQLDLLLLGTDAREGEAAGRTDTIILASIDTEKGQVFLLSVPRDTRVNIPGYGWDKINSAFAYGGPEMTTRVVSSLLGVPLRYYVLVDFNGFKRVVDTLGGVTIDVEQDMYHEDPEDNRAYQIDLKKGCSA